MEKKKNLKEVEGCERVFLADNLTAQRSKLLRKLKERDDVKSAWSIEGKIKAVLVKNGREKKVTIDSLDDVSELDFTEDEIEDLGLFIEDSNYNEDSNDGQLPVVTICSLIICGINSKLNNGYFDHFCSNFDILCLSETKTNIYDLSDTALNDFTIFTFDDGLFATHGMCILV